MATENSIVSQKLNKTEMSVKAKKELDIYANSCKEKLDVLVCPYTEGIEARCVLEMLLRPGEARIRLLQWLFCRFDYKLNDLLDPQCAPSNTKMDSRIQRLLFVASSLGFCKPEDADLIRGTASASRQRSFLDHLLDVVCIYDASADIQSRALDSPGTLSQATSIERQWQQDCELMNTLAAEVDLSAMFSAHLTLLPPDLMRLVAAGAEDRPSVPDLASLQKQAEQLSTELSRQSEILTELTSLYPYQGQENQATTVKISQTMKLVLSELSQLVVGFSYCFENELRPWCNKSPPHLNELGPAFKHVHTQLKHFTMLLQNLNTLKSNYTHLCDPALSKTRDLNTSLGLVGHAALESFQECVDILDESLVRHDRSDASTLQMSRISVT